MATIRSDLESMFSKLSPFRRVPREPDARIIAHRWAALEPFVLITARRAMDPAAAFAFFKERHAEYFTKLRRAEVSPDVIIRHSLDDPVIPPMQFEWLLTQAVERRRTRLGRIKGRGKKYTRRTNRKDTK